MGMTKKIKLLLVERNMAVKDLAEGLGISPSNLSNKLARDNFTEKDLRKIAEILNCDYEANFIMRETGKHI